MPTNRSDIHKHGAERFFHGHYPVFGRAGSYDLSHFQTRRPGMEIKVWILLLNIFGYPSTVFFLWFNWKSDIVFGLIVALWLIKIIRAFVRWHQEYKEREIEIKEKRKRYRDSGDQWP